jgi:DNA invertase Pin-like site-specific DNA recombinase
MNKSVLYIRYSDEKQNEQSVDGQIRVCKEYAKKNNLEVVGIYIDRALTGKNDNRPEFMRMIRDSYKKRFNYLIVYRLDRFARNKFDSAIHNHTLKKNGVRRLSAMENITDGPEGVLMESLLEGMAEYYSLELAIKVKRGIYDNLDKGNGIGGTTPLGYDLVDKKYVINDYEAHIVRLIFDLYLRDKNSIKVVQELKTRDLKDKEGRTLNVNRVLRALNNEKYSGVYTKDSVSYTNIYPQIVDSTTYESVKSILHKNKRSPGSNRTNVNYLLTGKLFCEKCGQLMIADSANKPNKTYHYYSCNKNRKHNCPVRPVSKDYIEKKVAELLVSKVLTRDVLVPIIDESIVIYNKENKDDTIIRHLIKEKKRVENELSNSILAIKNGFVSDTLQKEIISLEVFLKSIEIQIAKEQIKQPIALTRDDMLFMFDTFISDKDNENHIEKVIDTFVDKVIYTEKGVTITINSHQNNTYKLDFDDINSSIVSSLRAPSKNKSNFVFYKGYYIFYFNLE